jgi:hypothetical protein
MPAIRKKKGPEMVDLLARNLEKYDRWGKTVG